MLARTTLAIVLPLSLAGAAAAQVMPPPERPTIIVTGVGKATQDTEFANLGFMLRGEGPTPTEALKALNDARRRAEGGLRGMDKVRVTQVAAENLSVHEVRSPTCGRDRPYTQVITTDDCKVIGTLATLQINARIEPPSRIGDAASLVTQLGAKNASLRGSGLRNRQPLDAEAVEKAVADARRQAELLAKAAGMKLGPVLRMQDGAVQPDPRSYVMGAAPAPPPPPPMGIPPVAERLEQPLDLTVREIEANARVTIIYAIEPS